MFLLNIKINKACPTHPSPNTLIPFSWQDLNYKMGNSRRVLDVLIVSYCSFIILLND